MRSTWTVLAFVAATAAGCATPATRETPMTLPAADADAIRAAAAAYVTAMRDTAYEQWADMYTADALLLPPNMPPVQGREAMIAMVRSFPPVTAFDLRPIEIEGRGDLAYAYGRFTMTFSMPGGAAAPDSGKYIEIWRKQSDGGWKIARDMFNSDIPMTP